MKLFVLVASLGVLAHARPEAGYSYSPPSSSYGAPSGGGGGFGGGGGGGGGGGFGGGGTLIQKHIYVHVPPPEPHFERPRPIAPLPPPQKHYKIVFIKAPTPPTPTAPVIPQFPQDEQKTLIYVLVKKPEEAPEISIPTPAPTVPSKPEVYFIRYKTQKEAGGGGFGGGGPSSSYGPPG
ncbi:hypothetical protein L9F63_025935, partial [Diploptera punctata]